jgi:hypothetical protein
LPPEFTLVGLGRSSSSSRTIRMTSLVWPLNVTMIWSGMRGMTGDEGSEWELDDGDGDRDEEFMAI